MYPEEGPGAERPEDSGSRGNPKSCRTSHGQGRSHKSPRTLETQKAWLGGCPAAFQLQCLSVPWGLLPRTQVDVMTEGD